MKLSLSIIIICFSMACYLTYQEVNKGRIKIGIIEHHGCRLDGYGYVETSKIGTAKDAKVYLCPDGPVIVEN